MDTKNSPSKCPGSVLKVFGGGVYVWVKQILWNALPPRLWLCTCVFCEGKIFKNLLTNLLMQVEEAKIPENGHRCIEYSDELEL